MITRDLLHRAVSAVSSRDPEIGYGLTELLNTGSITTSEDRNDGDLYFYFEGEKVPVNRESIFIHGTEPVEERLVIKYGELVEKYKLQLRGACSDYLSEVKKVQQAGTETLVNFEIDRAVSDVKKNRVSSAKKADHKFIESILEILTALKPPSDSIKKIEKEDILYTAEISPGLETRFMPFPFSYDFLRQAAEIRLEYFHVRFLLRLFITGMSDMLYASAADGKITGLLLLNKKQKNMTTSLEVKYISTVNSVPVSPETAGYPRIKGTGTFLIAGTWLLWKQRWPDAHEIYLNAESGASDFYKSIGFSYRHPYGYSVKNPEGKLLLYITVMAMNLSAMPPSLERAMEKRVLSQIKYLKKNRDADDPGRKAAVLVVSSCMGQGRNTVLRDIAQNLLQKYSNKIPEAAMLREGLKEKDNIGTTCRILNGDGQIPVVWDSIFENHLKGVFHMESSKRIPAVHRMLSEDPLPDRITLITPRAATDEELLWVHKKEYIEKIAQTSGIEISSLDPDTQTTEQSYTIARLAAGGVFNLIDSLYDDRTKPMGVAFIRPPGHHAEPDRAMGFCIFNNIALGAEYAIRCHNAKRILIVDIDLHHGNGTQKIFHDRNDVLYFSVHQFPCFPGTGKLGETGGGRGEGCTVNVPVSMGLSDLDYQKIFHFMLCPVAREYKPDIIMVSLGFDLYHEDPLGKMNVSPEGYAIMTNILKNLALELCEGRLLFVMEGGYSINGIRRCGSRVMQELAGIPTIPPQKIDRITHENPFSLPGLKKAIEVHKEYWPCLKDI